MAKVTDLGSLPPDHPIFKEGLRSYSPHWARGSLKSTTATPPNTDGPTDPNPAGGKTRGTKGSSKT